MPGVKRQSGAPVEGLQIVHVDSPEVRRKYEAEAARIKEASERTLLAANERAEALEKELVTARADYARGYAEGKTLRSELAMLKAQVKPGDNRELAQAHNEIRKLRAGLDASAAEVASLRASLERARARLAATVAPAAPTQGVSLESLKAKAGKYALPERAALLYALGGGLALAVVLGLIRLFKKG